MIQQDFSRHDRGLGQSSLVYPVISRRSGGLSLGVNLFPGAKYCTFDCPYCEVSPFKSAALFSPAALEAELETFFSRDYRQDWAPMPLRDICLSGNGEPTLSPHIWAALDICAAFLRRYAAVAGAAPIVLITNSSGFLNSEISRRLAGFAREKPLKIWAKLDAGTQGLFRRMSRSDFRLDDITAAIARFARETPVIIQTMICSLDGWKPGPDEARAYASRVKDMLAAGARIEGIHFYTLARPPQAKEAGPLSDQEIALFMRGVVETLGRPLPMLGYGETSGEPLLPA